MPLKNHTTTTHGWMRDFCLVTCLFIVFYTFMLGSYPLFTPDEGRYSEVAREMIATHDFITPRVNGVAFLDKPILYYWLQAAAIYLFGIKEWALRLFPVLLGLLGCLSTYFCGRQLFDRRTGLVSAAILASTPLYFGSAHYANLDLEVAVWISCTLLFFITACQSEGKRQTGWFITCYVFAALAFLTKGLIAIAFPGLIGLTWMAFTREWRLLRKMHLVFGSLLFIAIVLPWYVLVQKANPEFLHFFFVTQQVTRFLSAAAFNNPTPFWFYLPVVLIGFLPWTLFLVLARHRSKNPTELFLLLWIGIVFIFFSIPHSKTVGYILPIFPALALLVGHHLAKSWDKLAALFWISFIASTIFLVIVVFKANELNERSAKPLVTQLKTILKPEDEVVNYFKFYHDVPLYLERRITLVANWQSPDIAQRDNWVRELWYGMPFQDTTDWLINEDTFWQHYNGERRVFVFLNTNYFNQFKTRAAHYYLIDQYNDIILLSNKPTTGE